MEMPHPVQRHYFLALALPGRQLESGVVGEFVDAQDRWILPIVDFRQPP